MSEIQKQLNGAESEHPSSSSGREWFLLDCAWEDSVWIFNPSSVLEEVGVRIYWNFLLPSGDQFTDAPYSQLLETCRKLIAVVRSRSLSTGTVQRAKTVAGYFEYLREVVRWMSQAGFKRFSELDEQSLLMFKRHLEKRPGQRRKSLSPTTILKYLYIFSYLHRFRDEITDGLEFSPFSGRSLGEVAGVKESNIGSWPYTPDKMAIPLIQGSIHLVAECSKSILTARGIYHSAMSEAADRGCGADARCNSAALAIREACIVIPGEGISVQSVKELAKIVDLLYTACFVIIAYLVGARASEILRLRAGCIQQRVAGGEKINVIVGSIFKRQPEYYGRPHEWVVPTIAIEAISVLEALSAPHRTSTGREELWLRRSRGGATEWHNCKADELAISSAARISRQLGRLSNWLKIPKYENKEWLFTTHQGRKTFARFSALRDRTSLFALAQHLGHRERAATDSGYSGSDYRLNEEIDAEILEQSVSAWEHMLATPGLGGRAGVEIVANRPRFRGSRLKQEIKSYARLLVDAGLVLGVCDWGFCVYRENSSACLGNTFGPNPVRREPSICARCANFAVSSKHRSYWDEQVQRCESLLNEPALPLQTIRIARERVHEAKSLLRTLDESFKGDSE